MEKLVIEFRRALDQIDWSSMPCGFKEFPTGTCGDISDILAEHLYQNGIENVTYVCGRSNGGIHAWLEVDGTAIDVTADQFEDMEDKVLIQSPEVWHHKYEIENRRKAGYRDMNGPAVSGLVTVHTEITRWLNA